MKKLGFVILGMIMAISMLGCTMDVESGKRSGSEGTAVPTPVQTLETKSTVGDTVTADGWRVTLEKAIQSDQVGDNTLFQSKASEGKTFVVLFFEVENISNKNDFFNMFYHKSNVDGYSANNKTLLNEIDGYSDLAGDVDAGKKRRGFMAWEVSADWKEIEYSYEELGGNRICTFTVTPADIAK